MPVFCAALLAFTINARYPWYTFNAKIAYCGTWTWGPQGMYAALFCRNIKSYAYSGRFLNSDITYLTR